MNHPFEEQDFDQAHDLIRDRQRFSRKAKPASALLNRLLARKGYAQQQSSRELDEHWNAIVDPRWHSKTKVGTLRQGVLEITVSNSSVSHHLNFMKRDLLKKLQTRMPQNRITDLRFRIGNIQ